VTFLAVWNLVFAYAITCGSFVVAVAALRQACRSHGLYRATPIITCLVCSWVRGLYLGFWVLQSIPIPPEYFRPSIFALVATILALLLGYRRYDAK